MTNVDLSRRAFVTSALAAGGGLMLGFHVPVAQAANLVMSDASKAPADGAEINACLTIDPKGVVTVRVPHTEMG